MPPSMNVTFRCELAGDFVDVAELPPEYAGKQLGRTERTDSGERVVILDPGIAAAVFRTAEHVNAALRAIPKPPQPAAA